MKQKKISYSLNSVRGDHRVYSAFIVPDITGMNEVDAVDAVNRRAKTLSIAFDDLVVEVVQRPDRIVARWQGGELLPLPGETQ